MISGPHVAKILNIGRVTFGRNIKSMESSRNVEFTHTVDYDMIEIIDD